MNISADTIHGPLLSAGYPQTRRSLRRDVRRARRSSPSLGRFHQFFIRARRARTAPPLANGKAANSGKRRHLQRLRRSAGNGSAVESGCHSLDNSAIGMEPARSGLDPARTPAESDSGRSLRSATVASRRPDSAGSGIRESGLLAAVPRSDCIGQHVSALARGRPGARAGWRMVGDFRPHAGAFRRGLLA